MEAIKYLICQKCGSNYKHSLGEMTARQFNTYINHDDRHEKPYSVIYCEFDKKSTLHLEASWELLEPEEE